MKWFLAFMAVVTFANSTLCFAVDMPWLGVFNGMMAGFFGFNAYEEFRHDAW